MVMIEFGIVDIWNLTGIVNDYYLYIMILLTRIIEDLTNPQVKESVDPSLIKLMDEVINDTNVLVVNNLKMIKDIISKEPIDKAKLDVALSNYKRYFNRDNGGTPEVIRGMTMQNKLDELSKWLV